MSLILRGGETLCVDRNVFLSAQILLKIVITLKERISSQRMQIKEETK